MATAPIYVGGGRRSAAPAYTPVAFPGTAAIGYDDELIRQLVGNMSAPTAPAVTAPVTPIAIAPGFSLPALAESIGSGSNVVDFGSPTSSTTSTGSTQGGISPGTIGAIGSGLSALGTLGQDANLGQVGGMLGLAGALGSAQSNSQALGIMGQAALGAMGVPGVGIAVNAVQGNVPGTINSVLGTISPEVAAINSLMGLATSTAMGGDGSVSLGDIGANLGLTTNPALSDVMGLTTVGPVDATQAAMAINASQDPLGSLAAVLGQDVSANTAAAVGAANAISAANNTNAMDALMGVTDAFGTAAPADSGTATVGGGTAESNAAAAEGLGGTDIGFDPGVSIGDTADSSTSDGGGGGGGGSKIICTKLHELGMMSKEIYEADQAFGKQLVAADPAAYYGYVRWAQHVVALMGRKDVIGKTAVFCAYHIATPWSVAMAEQMGMPVKSSIFGRFLLNYGIKLCRKLYKTPQTAGMLA